jgi:hypothetical protein
MLPSPNIEPRAQKVEPISSPEPGDVAELIGAVQTDAGSGGHSKVATAPLESLHHKVPAAISTATLVACHFHCLGRVVVWLLHVSTFPLDASAVWLTPASSSISCSFIL